MCYGLRTNFLGELFEGSSRLLSIADNLHEIKTICSMCTKKATMVIRLDSNEMRKPMERKLHLSVTNYKISLQKTLPKNYKTFLRLKTVRAAVIF